MAAFNKNNTRIVLKIATIILAVSYLVIAIIGVIGIATFKSFEGLSVGVLIFGLAGVAVSLIGFFGADFGINTRRIYKILVSIFFGGQLVLDVLFFVFGIACLCARPNVKYLMTLSYTQIIEWFSKIDDTDLTNFGQYLNQILRTMTIVGIFCIALAVVVLIGIVITTLHLGLTITIGFFSTTSSIAMMVLGLGLAIFLLIINPGTYNFGEMALVKSSVFMAIIGFSFIMTAVGAIGLINRFFFKRFKNIINYGYLIGAAILIISFMVILIVALTLNGSVKKEVNKYCDVEDHKPTCNKMLDDLKNNTCFHFKPENPGRYEDCLENDVSMDDLLRYNREMATGWYSLTAWTSVFIVIFVGLVAVNGTILIFKKKDESEEHVQMPPSKTDYTGQEIL